MGNPPNEHMYQYPPQFDNQSGEFSPTVYKEHVSSHCIWDSISAACVEEHSMNHRENIDPWGQMS